MELAFGPGTVLLGKYRVEDVLGRGGMGMVLRVTHLHLGEQLAIKVLLPTGVAREELGARFLREAQAAARLRGEHIARVVDVGLLPDGLPYMVMEHLRGYDLARVLAKRKRLPAGEAVDYVLQACEALAEAHAHGIVHRDIKPANLFVTLRPDNSAMIKVLDFGISKAPIAHHALTKTDVMMGTVGYMSPEQMKAARDVDERTDIWALGVVLYECLCGRPPFVGETFAAIVVMASIEPPPAMDPDVPRGLQSVVLRCLEKDRRARFSTIAALATALAPFARDPRGAGVIVDRVNSMVPRADKGALATTVPEVAGADPTRPDPTTGHQRGQVIPAPAKSSSALRWVAVGIAAAAVFAGVKLFGPHPGAGDPAPAPHGGNDCVELRAKKDWQGLLACGAALSGHGVALGDWYQSTARNEMVNERLAASIRAQIAAGELRGAETSLTNLSPDSVYAREVQAELTRADDANLQSVAGKVNAYLTGHNCDGLRNLVSLDGGAKTSTQRVVTFVQATYEKCLAERADK